MKLKSKGAIIIGIVCIFGLFLMINILPSSANGQFTNKSIQGTYGFLASGTIFGAGPIAGAGLFSFDGAGGCFLTDNLNAAVVGFIGTVTSTSCNYAVNPDGTGMINFTWQLGGSTPIPLHFAIVDNSKEINIVRVDNIAEVTIDAKRQ